jgi:hypothetical protein
MVTTTLENNGSSIPNIEMEPGLSFLGILVIITITWVLRIIREGW